MRAQAPGETQQKMETAKEKKKKKREESEREETEKKTNDHMKRKSHKERDRLCHTDSNSTLPQPSISTNTFVHFSSVVIQQRKLNAPNCNSSTALVYVLI